MTAAESTGRTRVDLRALRAEHGAEGVRALLLAVFAASSTATAACDALGWPRVASTGHGSVSRLRRLADRAGVPWPWGSHPGCTCGADRREGHARACPSGLGADPPKENRRAKTPRKQARRKKRA